MQTSQENFTTTFYAKFGGQTECIMSNWKIENGKNVLAETLKCGRTPEMLSKNACSL